MNRITVVTAPIQKPVTLAEARLHVAEDGQDFDDLIDIFIDTATEYCEAFQGRAYVSRTLDFYRDAFPPSKAFFELPLPPLLDVTGVFYTDDDGVEQEFTDFEVDTASEPGRIYIVPTISWPSPRVSANAVRVRYRAGYLDTDNSTGQVPGDIRAAILLYVGTLYANREDIVIGQAANLMPWGSEQLLRRRRIELSAA